MTNAVDSNGWPLRGDSKYIGHIGGNYQVTQYQTSSRFYRDEAATITKRVYTTSDVIHCLQEGYTKIVTNEKIR